MYSSEKDSESYYRRAVGFKSGGLNLKRVEFLRKLAPEWLQADVNSSNGIFTTVESYYNFHLHLIKLPRMTSCSDGKIIARSQSMMFSKQNSQCHEDEDIE